MILSKSSALWGVWLKAEKQYTLTNLLDVPSSYSSQHHHALRTKFPVIFSLGSASPSLEKRIFEYIEPLNNLCCAEIVQYELGNLARATKNMACIVDIEFQSTLIRLIVSSLLAFTPHMS